MRRLRHKWLALWGWASPGNVGRLALGSTLFTPTLLARAGLRLQLCWPALDWVRRPQRVLSLSTPQLSTLISREAKWPQQDLADLISSLAASFWGPGGARGCISRATPRWGRPGCTGTGGPPPAPPGTPSPLLCLSLWWLVVSCGAGKHVFRKEPCKQAKWLNVLESITGSSRSWVPICRFLSPLGHGSLLSLAFPCRLTGDRGSPAPPSGLPSPGPQPVALGWGGRWVQGQRWRSKSSSPGGTGVPHRMDLGVGGAVLYIFMFLFIFSTGFICAYPGIVGNRMTRLGKF